MVPPGLFPRLSKTVLAASIPFTLAGCNAWEPPGSHALFIYIQSGTAINEKASNRQNAENLDRQDLLLQLLDRYRRKDPKATIHVRTIPAEDLSREVRLRQNSGLGPDLVISDVRQAFELNEQRLTSPIQIPAERLQNISKAAIQPFQQNGLTLALPVSLQPQIACFNRARLPEPPQSLEQVLMLAARGHRMGLPIQLRDLAWTASGLAEHEQPLILEAIQSDRIPSKSNLAARRALAHWIDWIRKASLQQYVVFADSNDELYSQFLDGQLDWIPCRSYKARLLQKKLGPHFGATPLPGRTEGQPAAATVRVMAWSFGRHSSAAQQRMAKDFALFSLNEVNQKDLMLNTQTSLPVNTNVIIPVKSSQLLAAMKTSLQNGILLHFDRKMLMLSADDSKLQSLVRQAVLGESWTTPLKPTNGRSGGGSQS